MSARENQPRELLRVLQEFWPPLKDAVLKKFGVGTPDIRITIPSKTPFVLQPRDPFKLGYYDKYVRHFRPQEIRLRNGSDIKLKVCSVSLVATLTGPLASGRLTFLGPDLPNDKLRNTWSTSLDFEDSLRESASNNMVYELPSLDRGSVLPLNFTGWASVEFAELARSYHSGEIREQEGISGLLELRISSELERRVYDALPQNLPDVAGISLNIWTERDELLSYSWDTGHQTFAPEFYFTGAVRLAK